MTKTEERMEARKLRQEQGLSVNKIAEKIGVSRSTFSRWVKDIPLTTDQRHQLIENSKSYGAQHQGSIANKVKHRKIREAYQQAGREKAGEGDALHLAGCMLYWTEGTKGRAECRVTNSDPDMMLTFIRFLRQCFRIEDERFQIRITTYLGNGLSLEDIEQYWLDLLKLPYECLKQTSMKQPKSSNQRGRKLFYGTCELRIRGGSEYV
jgi:predicted transcriptional regulator